MAASDAKPIPQKNVAFRVTFPILDADGDLVTGAASLDSEISKDGGTFADCTNEATEIATSSGIYYLDLTSTEMNADTVSVIIKTSTVGAKTTTLVFYPEESGDIRVNLTQIAGAAVSTSTAQLGVNTVQAGGTAWGSGAITAASIATDAIDANALAAGAVVKLNTAVLSAIAGIGTAGGASINVDAATDNVLGAISGVTSGTTFLGTQSSGTYASTSNANGVDHVITGTASSNTAMDVVYQFLTGAGTNVVQATWVGYVTSGNDTISLSAWRHDTNGWELLTTIVGTSGNVIQTKNITLFSRHRGTSTAELGKVYLRLHCTGMTTPVVATDQIVVSYAVSSRGSYSDGAVWLNTNVSNTNTQNYVDGLPENPVSTIAAALIIAGDLGLKRIRVANGSSVTFGASMAAKSIVGKNWTCALGGQAIDGTYIEGASVSGTGTCTTPADFMDCHIGAGTTVGPCQFYRCGFSGSSGSKVTAGSAGEFLLIDCFSEVAGSGTPYFSFPGACGVNIRRWSGGSNIVLNNASATLTMEVVMGGGQTIDCGGGDVEIRGICRAITLTGITTDTVAQIDCVTGPISIAGADGTVNIYGVCGTVTDNRTGSPTLTNTAISRANINAEVDTAVADGVNITKVNNITIDGSGTALDPWGPA